MGQGSVTIMNPGYQSVLEHRVPASSEEAKSGVRFALSFRHFTVTKPRLALMTIIVGRSLAQ